ncbi:hypothetical protein BGW41_008128 [Actinomortierella wolfii]|nr:hypothetical protein BGW41_008128 [Actinomortierella wolfii]
MNNYSSPQPIPTPRSNSSLTDNNTNHSIHSGLSLQQRQQHYYNHHQQQQQQQQQQHNLQRPPLAKRAHSHGGHLDSGTASPLLASGSRRPLNLFDDYLHDSSVGDNLSPSDDDEEVGFGGHEQIVNVENNHQQHQRQRQRHSLQAYPGHHAPSQHALPFMSDESAFMLGSSSPKPRSFLTSTPPHRRSFQGMHASRLKGHQEVLAEDEEMKSNKYSKVGNANAADAGEEDGFGQVVEKQVDENKSLERGTMQSTENGGIYATTAASTTPVVPPEQPLLPSPPPSKTTSTTEATGRQESTQLQQQPTEQRCEARDSHDKSEDRRESFVTTTSASGTNAPRPALSLSSAAITINTSSECLRRPFSSSTTTTSSTTANTNISSTTITTNSTNSIASTGDAVKSSQDGLQSQAGYDSGNKASDLPIGCPKSRCEGQLSLSFQKQQQQQEATEREEQEEERKRQQFLQQQQDHLNATRPRAITSSTSYTQNHHQRPPAPGVSSLTSSLPPAPPMSSFSSHLKASSEGQSVLLPSLSPTSPRATNPALVNSLDQLSLSWKAPEQTPTFPINRLHRSRTLSSGGRPNFNGTGSYFPPFSVGSSSSSSSQSNPYSVVSPTTPMVTSSSYSSLPYSPAVAFLSNLVDTTTPALVNPDDEGEQVGDFIMGKVIGHGGFSVVREAFATQVDGLVARVAVKVVKAQPGSRSNARIHRMLRKELAIWSRLNHPNVVPFIAVEKLPYATFVFCELCTGGNLLDLLMKRGKGLPEDEARKIFLQIAAAVRYLHVEKQIVHRDIKLENVLQHEDGTWKICDFGLAEYQNEEAANYFDSPLSPMFGASSPGSSESSATSSRAYHDRKERSHSLTGLDAVMEDNCEYDEDDRPPEEEEGDDEQMVGGSLAYCSPEQLRSCTPLKCPSSDVWSLGVVLYALLTGRLPFQDEYEPRLQYQILNGKYEEPTECSPEARDLLRHMFHAKPEERWRIDQVLDSAWCQGTTLEKDGNLHLSGIGNGPSAAGFFNMGSFRF